MKRGLTENTVNKRNVEDKIPFSIRYSMSGKEISEKIFGTSKKEQDVRKSFDKFFSCFKDLNKKLQG